MRFLLDESAKARIAGFLTAHGHDATRIGRDYPASLPDKAVLSLAHREQRILISNAKDFGQLVVRKHHPHARVILFRFPLDSTAHQKIRALEALLASRPAPLDHLFVLTPQGIRTRRRPLAAYERVRLTGRSSPVPSDYDGFFGLGQPVWGDRSSI